ncbi:FAD-dependent oxidoreductase [Amycolatopsis sp. H20-H5]|uniref:FAD-dependent oxidoreductase n=1 Tax=Amycolatopsis sp. H20-H5 TaxID=3046309 RepID=UPI002DBA0DF9|nr:NAD(P)-binding protein [Amycolatopsis sp. H20-H5]MEC3977287.1 NAD(P)-binding protein [Amycolatopsis sp. H20-H5]
MARSSFHVLVIGADAGGLCLAHGLVKAGIDVTVYEQDPAGIVFPQGFRVGLSAGGSRALYECLPPESFDLFTASCAAPLRLGSRWTESLHKLGSTAFPEPPDPVGGEKAVSPGTLRQVLLADAGEFVRFGQRLTHHERDRDGSVTAYFADGTSATGDVLVPFRVRPEHPSHTGTVGGRVPLTAEVRQLLPAEMSKGVSMIFAPGGYFFLSHAMEFDAERRRALRPGVGEQDVDHLAWTVTVPDGERLRDLRGEELLTTIRSLTPAWSPKLHKLFGLTDPATCFTGTSAQETGVDTALRDARILRARLVAARDGGFTLQELETRECAQRR